MLLQDITRGVRSVVERRGRCRWCGTTLSDGNRRYCSKRCLVEDDHWRSG